MRNPSAIWGRFSQQPRAVASHAFFPVALGATHSRGPSPRSAEPRPPHPGWCALVAKTRSTTRQIAGEKHMGKRCGHLQHALLDTHLLIVRRACERHREHKSPFVQVAHKKRRHRETVARQRTNPFERDDLFNEHYVAVWIEELQAKEEPHRSVQVFRTHWLAACIDSPIAPLSRRHASETAHVCCEGENRCGLAAPAGASQVEGSRADVRRELSSDVCRQLERISRHFRQL